MANTFEKLSFTKDWNNSADFPTYEENEAKVRADLQALHDETKNFINNKLIPGIENLAVPGSGDMLAAIYDPNGKREDVFQYAEDALRMHAEENAESFEKTNTALTEMEKALGGFVNGLELLAEFKTAGVYTVEFPEDTAIAYAVIGGAGGGGAGGRRGQNTAGGGGGGAGGEVVFVGPLSEFDSAVSIVVGAGGAGGFGGSTENGPSGGDGGTGGTSSALGICALGGFGGGVAVDLSTGGKGGVSINGKADGGKGGSYANSVGVLAENGSGYGYVVSILAATASAGGGGGGAGGVGVDARFGAPGGIATMGNGGTGGKGGLLADGDLNGSPGEQGGTCSGGGGGGASGSTTTIGGEGGRGGDGYVSIWIQRKGV